MSVISGIPFMAGPLERGSTVHLSNLSIHLYMFLSRVKESIHH